LWVRKAVQVSLLLRALRTKLNIDLHPRPGANAILYKQRPIFMVVGAAQRHDACSENKPEILVACPEICTTFHGFRVPRSGMTTLSFLLARM
jgi:hypothetical protein